MNYHQSSTLFSKRSSDSTELHTCRGLRALNSASTSQPHTLYWVAPGTQRHRAHSLPLCDTFLCCYFSLKCSSLYSSPDQYLLILHKLTWMRSPAPNIPCLIPKAKQVLCLYCCKGCFYATMACLLVSSHNKLSGWGVVPYPFLYS